MKKEEGREGFWWELLNTFNPLYYQKIADRKLRTSFKHMLYGLGVSFIVLLILLLPFFVSLHPTLFKEMKKFDEFVIEGNVSMSEPIEIPQQRPLLVLDTTGTITKLEKQKVVITKDYIYFKHFTKTKRIKISKLLEIDKYKSDFTWMIIGFAALLIPSLIFYGFVIYLLKYLLIMLLLGSLFYITERCILLYKVKCKRIFNMLMFAVFPMALLEIAFIAIGPQYLVPLFSVYGISFYLVSTLVYLLLGTFGIILVERKKDE